MASLLLFEMEAGLHYTATNLIGFALYYNIQFDDRLLGEKGVPEDREDLCLIRLGVENEELIPLVRNQSTCSITRSMLVEIPRILLSKLT
ncbi:MAG: hypothetical protein JW743_00660 [Deltaproteobacteria bacterium]|nr:hypothetical protein [Deltaproteobacteria bacterium]MBN2845054.1 hypothetical protein [Deltaproteobacteria bacterium]